MAGQTTHTDNEDANTGDKNWLLLSPMTQVHLHYFIRMASTTEKTAQTDSEKRKCTSMRSKGVCAKRKSSAADCGVSVCLYMRSSLSPRLLFQVSFCRCPWTSRHHAGLGWKSRRQTTFAQINHNATTRGNTKAKSANSSVSRCACGNQNMQKHTRMDRHRQTDK